MKKRMLARILTENQFPINVLNFFSKIDALWTHPASITSLESGYQSDFSDIGGEVDVFGG